LSKKIAGGGKKQEEKIGPKRTQVGPSNKKKKKCDQAREGRANNRERGGRKEQPKNVDWGG